MEERRGRHSGQVTHVHCRTCDAPVLLDPAKMERKADHAELCCPGCGAAVHVRCTDIDRPRPEGIWSIRAYAEEPETELERIEHFFHHHQH
jgi:hypothetical protein